jgi:hypothetical protein
MFVPVDPLGERRDLTVTTGEVGMDAVESKSAPAM